LARKLAPGLKPLTLGYALFSLLFGLSSPEKIIKITAQTEFTDSLLVIKLSGLSPGIPYRQEEIAQAVKRIYQSGRFSEVVAETTRTDEGIILNFQTKDNPYLRDFSFSGNQKVKTKELKGKITIKPGEIISPSKIFNLEREILSLYKEKGFLLTKVTTLKSERDSLNRVSLFFQIEEGEKVRIKRIEFFGNKNLSAKALKKVMKNKEKRWYRKGFFDEEEFKEDLTRIINLYKEKGFLAAQIKDYQSQKEDGYLTLKIELEEGRRFFFGDVGIEGNTLFPTEELKRKLGIKKGGVYNYKKLNKGLQELYSLYTEEGYIYCTIVPQEEIKDDTVNIKLAITEGLPALIRLVKIEGNKRTEERVIRREIVTLPGRIFKRSEVLRSQRNVFNLGFFEDVTLDYQKVSEETSEIDLIYRVKEKEAFGTLGGGVTYSKQDGITGYIEITQPNFLGKGERISLKLEKGGRKSNLSFSFNEPYIFDRPISAGIELDYLTQPYDFYDKQDRSIDFDFSYPLPLDYLRGYLNLRVGQTQIPPRSISSRYQPTGPYTIYSDTVRKGFIQPGFSFIRDSRDYIFNPSLGSYYRYSQAFSFGQIRFFRSLLEERCHFPLFWKFSLMFRSRLGLVGEIKRGDTIPIYEKFYPGGVGDDGIRGYPDRSLGPKANGYPIGGKALLIFNLEYKLKLASYLSFILFFDCGNSYNSFSEINLANLKRGIGPGIRLEIPMVGLVGVDFGYGIDACPRKWEIHFQMGRVF